MTLTFTYAELSLFPLQDRERILQEWLLQFAWDVLNGPTEGETDD